VIKSHLFTAAFTKATFFRLYPPATLTCLIDKMTEAQLSYIYSVVSCKPDTLIDEHP